MFLAPKEGVPCPCPFRWSVGVRTGASPAAPLGTHDHWYPGRAGGGGGVPLMACPTAGWVMVTSRLGGGLVGFAGEPKGRPWSPHSGHSSHMPVAHAPRGGRGPSL